MQLPEMMSHAIQPPTRQPGKVHGSFRESKTVPSNGNQNLGENGHTLSLHEMTEEMEKNIRLFKNRTYLGKQCLTLHCNAGLRMFLSRRACNLVGWRSADGYPSGRRTKWRKPRSQR